MRSFNAGTRIVYLVEKNSNAIAYADKVNKFENKTKCAKIFTP